MSVQSDCIDSNLLNTRRVLNIQTTGPGVGLIPRVTADADSKVREAQKGAEFGGHQL